MDRPLSEFATRDAETPQCVRLVLSAELCASLAAHDPADAADTELPLLLQHAFQEALSERCVGIEHSPAVVLIQCGFTIYACCYPVIVGPCCL